MQVEKTAQGKIVLYDKKTGDRLERWPVDARGMVATGAYTTDISDLSRAKQKTASEPGEEPAIGLAGTVASPGVVFDPVKTPTMDPIGGATSPLAPVLPGEAILGASQEVTSLPPAEPVRTLADEGRLPQTTPLGAQAVHSTAADATSVAADQAPVRKDAPARRGGGKA